MRKSAKLFSKIFIMIMIVGVMIAGMSAGTVAYAQVKSPALSEKTITLYVKQDAYQIELVNLMKNAKVTYTTGNPGILKVNKTGSVTPVSKGTSYVTVKVNQNNKIYPLKLSVKVAEPYVAYTSSTEYLNRTEYYQFKAKTYGMEDKVVWSVSDESIAEIDAKGNFQAKEKGKVIVTASAGGNKAECTVTIGTNRIGTFASDITLFQEKTIWISIADYIEGEKLDVTSDHPELFTLTWKNTESKELLGLSIKPNKSGKGRITITSNQSDDRLLLNITTIEQPKQDTQLTPQEIYKKCGSSTVEVTAESPTNGKALGSGFFIGKGKIVTNYHVIQGTNKIQVKTYDDKIYDVYTVIGYDTVLDIAILGINSENDSLTLSQAAPSVGEPVYALGSPMGLTGTLSSGIVSTSSRIFDQVDYIQTTASMSSGNSGGPLLNAYGQVIGINTMCYVEGQNLNFAINIRELEKVATNRPVTVSEYYALYVKRVEDLINNAILEDPDKSQSTQTCQEIPSEIVAAGVLLPSEPGDCYKFTATKDCKFEAAVILDNEEESDAVYFDLYDSELNYIDTAYIGSAGYYQYMERDLKAGTYYVYLNTGKTTYSTDIYYAFIIEYE